MSEISPELEQTLSLALKLSPVDKVHLVERVVVTLESDLTSKPTKTKRSLYGIWSDVNVSEEDIDQARDEMWGDFPRKDI